MRFPFVSRLAYDTLAAQVAQLREDLAAERDHRRRLERAEHRLPETPRPPKPPPAELSPTLMHYLQGWPVETRAQEERAIRAALAKGRPIADLEREVAEILPGGSP